MKDLEHVADVHRARHVVQWPKQPVPRRRALFDDDAEYYQPSTERPAGMPPESQILRFDGSWIWCCFPQRSSFRNPRQPAENQGNDQGIHGQVHPDQENPGKHTVAVDVLQVDAVCLQAIQHIHRAQDMDRGQLDPVPPAWVAVEPIVLRPEGTEQLVVENPEQGKLGEVDDNENLALAKHPVERDDQVQADQADGRVQTDGPACQPGYQYKANPHHGQQGQPVVEPTSRR